MSKLIVSNKAIDLTIFSEITSATNYNQNLIYPVWPGGASGITGGVGYDFGHNTQAQIADDWKYKLPDHSIQLLKRLSGLRGESAKKALTAQIKAIKIPLEPAMEVFKLRTLPRYAALTVRAFPGVTDLLPDAAGVILDIVYNRGQRLNDLGTKEIKEGARSEMRCIAEAIPKKDYEAIAVACDHMARLWDGVPDFEGDQEVKLGGLVRRCKRRAEIVRGAVREYSQSDIHTIVL